MSDQEIAVERADALVQRSRRPEGPELSLLRLLCEQNGATVGQLMRWFGIDDRREMERLLGEYEDLEWLHRQRLLVGDDIWVWLSGLGDKLAGVGFECSMPHYGALAHLGAINDARIEVESKYRKSGRVRWFCERRLRSMFGGKPRSYLPDAVVFHDVVLADGTIERRRYAIEVELSRKTDQELHNKIKMNSKSFDLVIYFAVPEIADAFRDRGFLETYEKLRVTRIEDVDKALDQPIWRVEGDPRPFDEYGRRVKVRVPQLSEKELDGLDFLSEQGMAPMDQLERLLGISQAEMERMVLRWLEAGLVERAAPFVNQPSWVWLTHLGVKQSRLKLSREVPRLGALERARAVNEMRLKLTSGKKVEWIGRSRRRREGKGFGPIGVIRIGSQEHAVDLWTSTSGNYEFENRVRKRFSEKFKGLVWFYTEETRSEVVRFAEQYGSKRIRVQALPEAEFLSPRLGRHEEDGRKRLRDSSASAGPSGPGLWKRLASEPPKEAHALVSESVPVKALKAIMDSASVDTLPEVIEGWVELASLRVMWLVTDVGFFRVSHSGWGWHADEVEREDVFIVDEEAPAIDLRRKRVVRVGAAQRKARPFVEPGQFEMSKEVWERVRPVIPLVEERRVHRTHRTMSDRAVLSALIWRVRTGRAWEHLADHLEHGSWAAVYYRYQEWKAEGVWERIEAVLQVELPDGAELDWSQLESSFRSASRPFNKRQMRLLERMREDPELIFTLEGYREETGVTNTTATKDIRELAGKWMVIGTREGRQGFVFRVAPDLVARMERFGM